MVKVTDVPVHSEIYVEATGLQAEVLGIRPVYHRITGELVEDQVWVRLWVHGYGNEAGNRWDIRPYEAEYAFRTSAEVEVL